MGVRTFLRGLFLSEEQRMQERITAEVPLALERFRYLVSTAGADAAPGIWLRDLALRASSIRYSRVQYIRPGGGRSDHDCSLWASAKANEPIWWADRAVYIAALEEGLIVGGPQAIPGLWDKEMSEFISQHPALDAENDRED